MFMSSRYPLQQFPRCVSLRQGDRVRYIGSDRKIQNDYGNQELIVLAVDLVSGVSVCRNRSGQCLVGVRLQELELIT